MYLEILSVLLLAISVGSININRAKAKMTNFHIPLLIETLLFGVIILSFVMMTKNNMSLFSLKWYWALGIVFIINMFVSVPITNFYISIFGIKSKPQFSLLHGTSMKHNLHIADALITFALGTIVFFLI